MNPPSALRSSQVAASRCQVDADNQLELGQFSAHRRHQVRKLAIQDQCAGTRMGQDVGNLVRGQADIDRHQYRAELRHAEMGLQHLE